jgi:hypothetical protein
MIFVITWLVCAFVGWRIGSSKGRAGAGFTLGLLLGVIGIIVIAVMRPRPEFAQQRSRQTAVAAPPTAYAPPVRPAGDTLPPPQSSTYPSWQSDPSRRHPMRWWDGLQWTQYVCDAEGGSRSEDPPVPTLE